MDNMNPYEQNQNQESPRDQSYAAAQSSFLLNGQGFNYPASEQKAPQGGRGLAIASLVLGIVSSVFFCAYVISIPAALTGLVLGIISLAKHREGKGMAIAGLILSAIGLLCAVMLVVYVVTILQSEEVQELMQEILNNAEYGADSF